MNRESDLHVLGSLWHRTAVPWRQKVLGWMIVFALMAILGAAMTLTSPAAVSTMVGLMFALLFLIGLLTRLVRGRAW